MCVVSRAQKGGDSSGGVSWGQVVENFVTHKRFGIYVIVMGCLRRVLRRELT